MKINYFFLRNGLLTSLTVVLVSLSQARAESRHALVIGNNAYENARALVNPKNDAVAIAAKLRGVGFEVTERTDATNKGMKDALREFSGKIPEGSVCLIYYAGHGVQIKGQNYLVPIDAKMAAEYEVPDETLCMDTVVRALGETKSKLNIFVLDCCRDDPFARSWKGSRSVGGSGGLVMPADMPQGMFVAFSTSPNTTAEDGDGNNSPYATALLEELGQPGVDFESVFKSVGAKVVKATGGKQEPWSNSKFYGKFSFVISGGGSVNPAPVPTTSPPASTAMNSQQVLERPTIEALEAMRPIFEAAEKEDSNAQYEIGLFYLSGKLGVPDYTAGATWLTRAAKGGSAKSQYNLASLYERGLGVKLNLEDAGQLYTLAANQGHGPSTLALARLINEGHGTKSDPVKAWALAKLAQERGVKEAVETIAEISKKLDSEQKSAAKDKFEKFRSSTTSEPGR